jgi:hypothetical protein
MKFHLEISVSRRHFARKPNITRLLRLLPLLARPVAESGAELALKRHTIKHRKIADAGK